MSLNCTRRFKNLGNYWILESFQQLKHFIKDLVKPDRIWVRSFKRLVLISLASATATTRQQLLKPVGHGCTFFTSLLADNFTLIDMHQFGVDMELALLPQKNMALAHRWQSVQAKKRGKLPA